MSHSQSDHNETKHDSETPAVTPPATEGAGHLSEFPADSAGCPSCGFRSASRVELREFICATVAACVASIYPRLDPRSFREIIDKAILTKTYAGK